MTDQQDNNEGLYIMLFSMHGLIRGHDLELGRDADTGGQVLYVVELARALARHPAVARVDLMTRQVHDAKVHADYAEHLEVLGPKAHIVRLPCGPRRYLRKEVLWPYLDCCADNALQHVRRIGRVPDIIHGHYADAGYVAAHVAGPLGVPMVYTGHSLGRVKRERLLEHGVKRSTIENQYNIEQRIEAEEIALDNAALVVASTHQEVEEQYSVYENYQPRRMVVIPPGVDLSRFTPPRRGDAIPPIREQLERFLRHPDKPMILALSRPDERKNIATLVRAYAHHPKLRALANLVIVAGNRDDIAGMEKGPREVLTGLLQLIDRYDLYGSVAYPKHHSRDDVPDLYRLAAKTHGVFVNPALTEPFGLTLIEAAASGLPMVATADGGPRDIIGYCDNGKLVDPLDEEGMANAIYTVLSDRGTWTRWSKNGVRGVNRHFSWDSHVSKYLQAVKRVLPKRKRRRAPAKSRLPMVDRIIVCDIDNTLIGDRQALAALMERVRDAGHVAFGIATGRRIDSALEVLKQWSVPIPELLITAVGSEVYYRDRPDQDASWRKHITHRWDAGALRSAMSTLPGLRMQPQEDQREHKISYFYDPARAPSIAEIYRELRKRDLHANLIYSHEAYLDLLPIRASKGQALRFLGMKWGLPAEHCLVAGDSGNDDEMLSGNMLGVVVGNYSPELERLRGKPRIYFADGHYAAGVFEGIEHYDFLGAIRIPGEGDES